MAKKYTYGHGGEAKAISLTDQMHEAKEIIGAVKWNALSDGEKMSLTKYLIMKGEIEGEGEDYSYADGGMMADGGKPGVKSRYAIVLRDKEGKEITQYTTAYNLMDATKQAKQVAGIYSMSLGKVYLVDDYEDSDSRKQGAKALRMMRKMGMMEPRVIRTQFEDEEFEYAKGGGVKKRFSIGDSIYYKPLKSNILGTSLTNKINKYADQELVIEKIEFDMPYSKAKVVVKSTGEKTDVFLNPSVKPYKAKMADGGYLEYLEGWSTKRYKVIGNDQGMLYVIDSNLTKSEAEQVKREEEKEYPGDQVFIIPNDEDIKEYLTSFSKGGMMAKGGAIADLSIKEKSEMFSWIDKELMKGSTKDLYSSFSKKFGKSLDESEDIIDNGWAVSRGAGKKMADGGMMAKGGETYGDGGFFGLFSKNKLKVGDILLINPYNLPPMRNGSQYFKVLPSTKLRVEKITDDYFIRRIGIDEGSVNDLNQYNKEDIDTFLKEGRLIKEKMADGGMMMAHGGKTHRSRHRKKTLEEKAMESVGSDTWFQLDKETQAGVIAEMVTIGALPQRMAKGSKVSKDFTVTYELMDGKKVVEKYGTEEEMDNGIANFYIMNDVKDAIVGGDKVEEVKEEVLAKPKKKSLFDTEKAAPKVSKSKETAPVVHVDGLEKEISRYDELKAIIKNADAEKEIVGGLIKDIAKEKYLEVYEQQGKRPTSIIIESGGTEISYTVLDKYKLVTPEKETVLKEYDNLLGTDYTFTFDNEILDQTGKNGEKIADIINDLIENSDDIPDDVKSKLVKITKKVGVKKGSIEKLLAYKSPAEILQVIEPVEMLK